MSTPVDPGTWLAVGIPVSTIFVIVAIFICCCCIVGRRAAQPEDAADQIPYSASQLPSHQTSIQTGNAAASSVVMSPPLSRASPLPPAWVVIFPSAPAYSEFGNPITSSDFDIPPPTYEEAIRTRPS